MSGQKRKRQITSLTDGHLSWEQSVKKLGSLDISFHISLQLKTLKSEHWGMPASRVRLQYVEKISEDKQYMEKISEDKYEDKYVEKISEDKYVEKISEDKQYMEEISEDKQ